MSAGSWSALLPVLDALDALGVTWHVGGSVASGLHGVFRSTNAVDVVAAIGPAHASPLARALEPTHAIDPGWILDAIRRRGSFNAVHFESGTKIDVFVAGGSPLDAAALARSVPLALPGSTRTILVKSPEDIVLQKLLWRRDGGGTSERQWLDALGVAKLQGDALDRAYLAEWSDRLGLRAELDRLLAEAGLDSMDRQDSG